MPAKTKVDDKKDDKADGKEDGRDNQLWVILINILVLNLNSICYYD